MQNSIVQPNALPKIWLISDSRNDGVLDHALSRLPRGSGFIYRHYHLGDRERYERFRSLCSVAKGYGHTVILADSAITAKEWGADGIYGSPRSLAPRREGLLHLATVHDMRELGLANRLGADGVLVSPVFATTSHPGGQTLGPARFHLLAKHSTAPVIALGGMTKQRARTLKTQRWAAIDGLS